jgi:hypothetical protein
VLAHAKTNLGILAPALRLRIEGKRLEGEKEPINTAGIAWLGEARGVTAADLVATDPPDEQSAYDDAKSLLADLLSRGPVLSDDAEKARKEKKVPERAWRRAKVSLGVKPKKEKGRWSGPWYLALPEHLDTDGKLVSTPAASIFGGNGTPAAENPAPIVEDGRIAEDVRDLFDGVPPPTSR